MTAEPAAPSRSPRRPRQLAMDRRAGGNLPRGTDPNETTDVLDKVRETGEHVRAGVRGMFGIMFTNTVPSECRDWADIDREPPGDRGRYAPVASCPSQMALDAALEARAVA
jgi:hypothetical protein